MTRKQREYTGPLYKQIEEAEAFVLRNIRLGVKLDGLIRKESYELPIEAIREVIVNAHCHRNLTYESCVQVAIYDDRLEVTSPLGENEEWGMRNISHKMWEKTGYRIRNYKAYG